MESKNNSEPGAPEPAEPEGEAPDGPPTDGELPRRFERFTLLRRIARGGMGELYLASTAGIEGAERPCVLKLIRKEHGEDASFRARFLDEARIQSQLQHPGVAQILEATTDATGHPYVVLEYIEGRNLAETRSRLGHMDLRINWPDAVAIGVSLGDALIHVHERTDAAGKPLEIAHRDLSPQNVMLSYHGDLKLVDFGTARGENRRSKTIKGVVFAKPGYVAPEVVNQEPGGAPADLYAFGIILWELVAGRRFLSGDASTHMAEVGAGQRNPPSLAHSARIPRALDTIIARLTAPRIQDRYASARQATADLVELLSTAPSPTGSDRSVRGRIAQLMQRLYPGEPTRSRQEFASLLASTKILAPEPVEKPRGNPAPRASKHALDLLAGTRYRLVRELGRGGMGVVHEAVHMDLDRRVALKVLTKNAGEGATETLRTEARTIASIRHKNLVKLYDFGTTDDGQPYYAMELLKGESLETKLRRTRGMDWKEAVQLARQACDALSAAHGRGVVHRDIKPANLFVLETGVLKLLDFGVAKIEAEIEKKSEGEGSAPLCITGTPEYISPEQARGRPADARSDVYALGVVLYELVTGRLPHDGATTVALLDAKIRTSPKTPLECAPERSLPRQLNDVLLRALEPVPELRYQTAAEFREALGRVRKRTSWRQRRAVLGSLAAGSALLLLLGVALVTGSAEQAFREIKSELGPVYAALTRFGVEEARNTDADPTPLPATISQIQAEEPAIPNTSAVLGEEEPEFPTEITPEVDRELPDQNAASDGVEPLAAEQPEPPTLLDDEAEDPAAREPDSEASLSETGELPRVDTGGVTAAIERAAELSASGRKLKAFYTLKRAGLRHYSDPRALEAWSRAAAETRTWGEAVRVARRWAQVDPRPEAMLHLARMLRRTGHRRESIGALYRLLRAHPDCAAAEDMLVQIYGRQPKVALAEPLK